MTETTEHTLSMKGTVFLKAIKNGTKKYEGRVYADKCQKMRAGHHLRLFEKEARWGILCLITSIDTYPDFQTMLKNKGILSLLPQLTGDAEHDSQEELMRKALTIYHGFPGSQRAKKFGVAAIGVKWLRDVSII